MEISFRMAGRGDCAIILDFIRALAVYEKRADQVTATVRELEEWLFDKQVAEVLLASVSGGCNADGIKSGDNAGDVDAENECNDAGGINTKLKCNDAGEKYVEFAGFALFFPHYSTFLGLPGLYLEDIFVHEKFRGRGVGTAMMRELARIAVGRGYGRFEWSCLDWNAPSIEFYLKLGAEPLDEWTTYRLAGDALRKLAQ